MNIHVIAEVFVLELQWMVGVLSLLSQLWLAQSTRFAPSVKGGRCFCLYMYSCLQNHVHDRSFISVDNAKQLSSVCVATMPPLYYNAVSYYNSHSCKSCLLFLAYMYFLSFFMKIHVNFA